MRRHRLAAAVLVLMATTACGARWSEEERAAVLARNAGTGSDVALGGPAAGRSSTASTLPDGTPVDGPGATGSGSGGGGAGGSGTAGATGSAQAAGARPCAAKSDAPGVSDETISVGNISTVSGPVPGLGESSVAAARAYVAYRNATGGVCGRQVELRTADDGNENSRYRAALIDMEPRILALAGGFAGGDGGGVDILEAKKIPAVLTAFTDSIQASPQVIDINPPFENVNVKTGKFQYLWDIGVRTAALVYIDLPQVKSEVEKQRALMKAVGIEVVYEQAVPLSTLSYDAAARGVANSKADYLFYPAAGNLNASMARSMYETGYKLKVGEYLTAYGSNFIELAGEAAEDGVSFSRALPSEEAGGNQEQSIYLEWMDRVAPGVPADTFAADAWAATKALFEAIESLPGPISRDALMNQLRSVGRWDADGFFGPIDLGKKRSNGCVIGMKVVNGRWQRLFPDKGFVC